MDALSPAVSVRPGATTAVVWASRAFEEPKGLLHALAKGGLAVVEVAGPFAALAELCRLERVRSEHQRSGAPIVPPAALVLVFPERLDDALGLIEAAERYVPAVKCWMFGPGANPRLRPIVQEDRDTEFGRRGHAVQPHRTEPDVPAPVVHVMPMSAQSHAPSPPAPVRPTAPGPAGRSARTGGAPALRLAGGDAGAARFQSDPAAADAREGEMIGPSPAPAGDGNGSNRPRQLLTTDELRMLLEEPGT